MDGPLNLAKPRQHIGALFEDDFDLPDTAPDPEVIEPVFSAAELAEARDAALQQGHVAGLEEAAASDAAVASRALEAIASQLAGARDAAASLAEQSAEAIARLLLDALAAAFPMLCARYGEAEVQTLVRAILPALTQEQVITVRVNPHTALSVSREIDRLEPDLAARVQMNVCDGMPPGDVRIGWRNGTAARDAAALWQQVAAILAPAGLLRSDALIRETVDGD